MSTNNPPSFRIAFESQIAKLPPEHQTVIRTQMNAITDLQGAIPALKTQIDALKSSTTGTTSSSGTATIVENVTTINNTVSGGPVNNRSGNTAYTTAQGDNGALLIFSDASPVAVTLNNSVTLPWYCFCLNSGVGLVTLTPQLGLINGLSTETLTEGLFSAVFFDGSNFWAASVPIVPANTPGVPHEWFASYDSVTGAFTLSRPAFTDISGTATTAQIGTGTPSAGKYVDGAAGAWTALPAPPTVPTTIAPVAGEYLTGYNSGTGLFSASATPGISVTITTAALTSLGTQGSQTFTNGILTASTPAT